jgi:RNA polymerase sigma-70 factor (ECF subfamily)
MQSFASSYPDNDHEIAQNLRLTGIQRRNAEEKLFNKYAYYIKEGMRKYSISEEDAFDAYADTVLAAIETITKGSFENRSSLKTYLYRIFQNKCVDIVRKKTTNKSSIHRTSSINDMLIEMSDTAKTVIQDLIDKADHKQVRAKLEELGEKCKQLLSLFAEGYSDKEIAVIAEYKTGEVAKTSRIRCLEKLRQLYKQT